MKSSYILGTPILLNYENVSPYDINKLRIVSWKDVFDNTKYTIFINGTSKSIRVRRKV